MWEYRYIIIVAVGILIYALFEWQNFKILAYSMMLRAKSLAKDLVLNSGKEQEDWVCEKLYLLMPARLKLFINNPEKLRPIVHYLYEKAKDYLDDGKLNNSIQN